jgi:hypothetical protein
VSETNSNTSATGGPLLPAQNLVIDDDAFADLIQSVVAGILTLPPSLVRPRWQAPTNDPNLPPTQPSPSTDWCAIGIVTQAQDGWDYEYELATPQGIGSLNQAVYEEIGLLASFYGPHARGNASLLRRSLQIKQNLDPLYKQGVKLRGIGTIRAVPEAVNLQWISRVDLEINLTREIITTYPIEYLVDVVGTLNTDQTPPAAEPFDVPVIGAPPSPTPPLFVPAIDDSGRPGTDETGKPGFGV